MKGKCIAIVMEQARKLRKLLNKENPVEKNLDFLKVMGNENYRHSMDDLYTASNELNKSCNKAKVIIEMQWWRLIKQKSLTPEAKEMIISDLNNCKKNNEKYLKDFAKEIDNMICLINNSK